MLFLNQVVGMESISADACWEEKAGEYLKGRTDRLFDGLAKLLKSMIQRELKYGVESAQEKAWRLSCVEDFFGAWFIY